MSAPQRAGRHRKDAGGREAGGRPARGAAVSVGICAGCLFLLGLIYGYIACAALGRAIRFAWRWLGLRGRLKVGMSASLFAALLASGIDPGAWLTATVAGLAGFGVCGAWLVVAGARGRRRWREHGGTVITGGGDSEAVGRNSGRLDALEEQFAVMQANLAYLVGGMAQIGTETGLRLPDVESTNPALRALPGGKAAS